MDVDKFCWLLLSGSSLRSPTHRRFLFPSLRWLHMTCLHVPCSCVLLYRRRGWGRPLLDWGRVHFLVAADLCFVMLRSKWGALRTRLGGSSSSSSLDLTTAIAWALPTVISRCTGFRPENFFAFCHLAASCKPSLAMVLCTHPIQYCTPSDCDVTRLGMKWECNGSNSRTEKYSAQRHCGMP